MDYKTVGVCGNLTIVGTTQPWFTPPPHFEETYDWLNPALLTTYLEFYSLEEQDKDVKRRTNVCEHCSHANKSTAAPGRQAVKNYVTCDTTLFWTDKRPVLRIYFFTCCTWELNRRLTSSCLEFRRSKAIALEKFENGEKTLLNSTARSWSCALKINGQRNFINWKHYSCTLRIVSQLTRL